MLLPTGGRNNGPLRNAIWIRRAESMKVVSTRQRRGAFVPAPGSLLSTSGTLFDTSDAEGNPSLVVRGEFAWTFAARSGNRPKGKRGAEAGASRRLGRPPPPSNGSPACCDGGVGTGTCIQTGFVPRRSLFPNRTREVPANRALFVEIVHRCPQPSGGSGEKEVETRRVGASSHRVGSSARFVRSARWGCLGRGRAETRGRARDCAGCRR